MKKNNILIENYKDMIENLDFEQAHYSKIAESIYKVGHASIKLMKWLAYYNRFHYENINY